MRLLLLRLLAAVIDVTAAVVLCLLLSTSLGVFFSARAVPAFEIGSPDTIWKGALPMLISNYGTFFYGLPFALFVVWLNEPIAGISLGKLVMRLRIVSASGDASSRSALWKRALVKTSGLWLLTLALLVGRWELVAVSATAGGITLLGLSMALGPSRRALHEHISGTQVLMRGA